MEAHHEHSLLIDLFRWYSMNENGIRGQLTKDCPSVLWFFKGQSFDFDTNVGQNSTSIFYRKSANKRFSLCKSWSKSMLECESKRLTMKINQLVEFIKTDLS